jgi:hypothetical protein
MQILRLWLRMTFLMQSLCGDLLHFSGALVDELFYQVDDILRLIEDLAHNLFDISAADYIEVHPRSLSVSKRSTPRYFSML